MLITCEQRTVAFFPAMEGKGLLELANPKRLIADVRDDYGEYPEQPVEHLVGQELYASQVSMLFKLHFWVREKKQSNAEVDFVLPHGNKVIPIEVKSGATGRLRSLHWYMDQADHQLAVRLYAGKWSREKAVTLEGKAYQLLNLPYYLGSRIERYLDWAVDTAPEILG